MKSRREIKESAKELLGRQIFGNKWLYMLLAFLVVSLIEGAISVAVVGLILAGCFSVGLARMLLRVARKEDEQANIVQAFSGFTDGHIGDNIILGLLTYIFILLWSLLFIIPGIVKSYSYAMAKFIKVDNPEMDANQCITESRKLMKGHKWRLFILDLSFIGWYLLGMLCLGIGVLWVIPYHETAKAQFYRSLIGEQF